MTAAMTTIAINEMVIMSGALLFGVFVLFSAKNGGVFCSAFIG